MYIWSFCKQLKHATRISPIIDMYSIHCLYIWACDSSKSI